MTPYAADGSSGRDPEILKFASLNEFGVPADAEVRVVDFTGAAVTSTVSSRRATVPNEFCLGLIAAAATTAGEGGGGGDGGEEAGGVGGSGTGGWVIGVVV